MQLSEILDTVLLESGMDTESAYVASTDDAVVRLVNIANRAGRKIATGYTWQALRKTHLFSMTTATSYDLPEDFRELIPDTAYTDAYVQPIRMRTDPSHWRYLQSNSGGSGPRYQFRILGGSIQVFQPNSGDVVTFEYLSDYPVLAADGVTKKKRFTVDTDTWCLDDDLLTMEIIWRYKKLLSLPDWKEDREDARDELRKVLGQDAGADTIIGASGDGSTGPYTDLWVDNA